MELNEMVVRQQEMYNKKYSWLGKEYYEGELPDEYWEYEGDEVKFYRFERIRKEIE